MLMVLVYFQLFQAKLSNHGLLGKFEYQETDKLLTLTEGRDGGKI